MSGSRPSTVAKVVDETPKQHLNFLSNVPGGGGHDFSERELLAQFFIHGGYDRPEIHSDNALHREWVNKGHDCMSCQQPIALEQPSLLVVCTVDDEPHHYFFQDTPGGLYQAKRKFEMIAQELANHSERDKANGGVTLASILDTIWICRVWPGVDLLTAPVIVRSRDFPQHLQWKACFTPDPVKNNKRK